MKNGKNAHIIFIANILVFSLWLFLFRDTFAATYRKFSIDLTFFGKLVLLFIVSAFIYRFITSGSYKKFLSAPALNVPVLACLAVTAGLHVYNIRYVSINIISFVLFILGTYFLLCLYFPLDWRRNSIIPLFLLICALPVSYYLEMTVGFPLRLWSADAIAGFLRIFGIDSASRESIIFIESRATRIDLSCSGIKGIWAAGLFYFAAAWINRKQVTLKLLLGALAAVLFVLAANLGRIFAMTVADTVLKQEKLAGFMHEPLGVAGFVISCGLAYFLFLQPDKQASEPKIKVIEKGSFVSAALIAVMLSAGLVFYSPKKPVVQPASTVKFGIKGSMRADPVEFTKWEKSVFSMEDTPFSGKYRFSYRGLTGSFLVVLSRSWRSQHNPLFCIQGMGLKADNYGPYQVMPGYTVMLANLDNGTKIATFWFQDRDGSTDDYSKRIMAGLKDDNAKWAMVSVLFDRAYDRQSADFIDFHTELIDNVKELLK
jgi:exosortase O